jgi:hypothetical protein
MVRDALPHRRAHVRDETTFGDSRFGVIAGRFAHFFGTPKFIIGQTLVVACCSAEAGAHHGEDVATRQRELIEENTVLTKEVKNNTDSSKSLHRHVTATGTHLGIVAGELDPDGG